MRVSRTAEDGLDVGGEAEDGRRPVELGRRHLIDVVPTYACLQEGLEASDATRAYCREFTFHRAPDVSASRPTVRPPSVVHERADTRSAVAVEHDGDLSFDWAGAVVHVVEVSVDTRDVLVGGTET